MFNHISKIHLLISPLWSLSFNTNDISKSRGSGAAAAAGCWYSVNNLLLSSATASTPTPLASVKTSSPTPLACCSWETLTECVLRMYSANPEQHFAGMAVFTGQWAAAYPLSSRHARSSTMGKTKLHSPVKNATLIKAGESGNGGGGGGGGGLTYGDDNVVGFGGLLCLVVSSGLSASLGSSVVMGKVCPIPEAVGSGEFWLKPDGLGAAGSLLAPSVYEVM